MPDPKLAEYADSLLPRLNDDICRGFAVKDLRRIPDTLARVLRTMVHTVKDWTYEGYDICSPAEQYAQMARPLNSQPASFDLMPSDFYMIRHKLRYKGREQKPRYQLIPFAREPGTVRIFGTAYEVSPCLTDLTFTVERHRMFLAMIQTKLIFQRMVYAYTANGATCTADLVWSRIHRSSAASCTSHMFNYILCDYGLTAGIKYVTGKDVVLTNRDTLDDTIEALSGEHNPDDWVVCESRGVAPRRHTSYRTPDTIILVKKDDNTRTMQSCVGVVFHILDEFFGGGIDESSDLENVMPWKRALARVIWNGNNEMESLGLLEEHLKSIRRYVDTMMIERFRQDGLDITTFNELLRYVICNFSMLLLETDLSSVANKVLTCVEPVIFRSISMFYRILYKVDSMPEHKISVESLDKMLDRNFSRFALFQLAKDLQSVNVLSTATDSMLFHTSLQVFQGSQRPGASSNDMNDPKSKIHPTWAPVYSTRAITGSKPAGNGIINPFLQLDENNRVVIPERLAPNLKAIAEYM